ncbi:MAG TPA: hypothetical protein VIV60_02475, partial [Polyangiaceae bacterium]
EIPCYEPPSEPVKGELVGVTAIAEFIGVDRAAVFYWLREGFIPGEQVTAGAPWRVRITDQLRSRFRQVPPAGYVALREAIDILGISRQAIWKRVKRRDLECTYVTRGRHKGLFVKLDNPEAKQAVLFKTSRSIK